MKFNIVLEPSDEGGYTVYVPSLSGCISEGNTIEEAIANIREARSSVCQEHQRFSCITRDEKED